MKHAHMPAWWLSLWRGREALAKEGQSSVHIWAPDPWGKWEHGALCRTAGGRGGVCVYIKRRQEGRAGLRPPPGKCLSNSSPLLAGCFGSHGVLPDSPPAPEPQRSGLPTLPHIRQCGAPASPCPRRPGWLPPGRTPH